MNRDEVGAAIPRDRIMRNRGFTLIEVMIATVCLVLLIGPMLLILRSGARVSRKGMTQIETTLAARRIIQLIHDDLKNACLTTGNRTSANFGEMMKESGSAPNFSYSFLRFPFRGEVSQAVPTTTAGVAPRQASRVRLIVEKPTPSGSGKPFLQLVREETFPAGHPAASQFPGGVWRKVLSDRVNYFRIQVWNPAVTGGLVAESFYWVTLQLVDRDPSVPNTPPSSGDVWTDRAKGLLIADFFDVVYPEFYNALSRHPLINRNWHTPIDGPP